MLPAGRHLRAIHSTADEQLAVALPFLRAGLARGERCVFIAPRPALEALALALSVGGVDARRAQAEGRLLLLLPEDTYLRGGAFDPQATLDLLGRMAAEARAAGFAALRGVGDMGWAREGHPRRERLLEYEARLNQLCRATGVSAICQYQRRRSPASLVEGVLRTHPTAVLGRRVCANPYYEPPEEVLGTAGPGRLPSWAAAQLERLWGTGAEGARHPSWEAAPDEAGQQRRYRELVEGLDAVVWEADGTTLQHTFVSRRVEALLGYPVARWLEEAGFWASRVHPQDRAQAVASRVTCLLEGAVAEVEYRFLAADGRVVWLRDTLRGVRDAAGRVVRLRGAMVDVTRRREGHGSPLVAAGGPA